MVLVTDSAEAVVKAMKSVSWSPTSSHPSLGPSTVAEVAVTPSRRQGRMQSSLWFQRSQVAQRQGPLHVLKPQKIGRERLTVGMFTLAGKNWSNAQDLPPGFCPARASELLQNVGSFVTLSPRRNLGETKRGRERDGQQDGMGACFLPSAALAT